MSDSLWPHELQHARLPCPSLSPRVGSNSCPLSQWCHSTISSSVALFFSCPQSFPGCFPVNWLFPTGGQRIGASASVLPSSRIDWFELFAVQGTLKCLLQHHNSKASILWCSAFFMVQLLHLYVTTGNTIALTRWTFVGKVMSLRFNTLSRFVVAFLPRSKCLNIVAVVTIHNDIGTHENKICHCLHFFPKLVERNKS